MYMITCRCGKSQKNFKFNIGDFYIEDCCEAAGYDSLGNKAQTGMSDAELDALTKDLDSATDLVITDELSLDAHLEQEEAPKAPVKPLKPIKPAKPAKPAKE